MSGWYEIRVTGPGREQFRYAELSARGLKKPAIAVITGMRKKHRTVFSEGDYEKVRALGDDHRDQVPRRIAK